MIYSSHTKHPSYHRVVTKGEQRFWKRILIVDDNEDITTTFRTGIEDSNNSINVIKRIEVHTSNDPVLALSEFKPHMNGFELCEKILAIDINIKVCFMSSDEINRKVLREIYPAISVGCFIRKPVNIDFLIK